MGVEAVPFVLPGAGATAAHALAATAPFASVLCVFSSRLCMLAGVLAAVLATWLLLVQRRAQRQTMALHDSEQRWQNLLRSVPQIGVVLDRDARITFVNQCFLDKTGWTEDDILGRDWFEACIPPDIREEIESVFRRTLKSKQDKGIATTYENQILTRSGQLLDVAWYNTVTRAPGGRIQTITCLGVDRTEHKRADRILQKSEARFRGLLAALPDMVWLKAAHGTYQACNLRFEAYVGASEADIVGKTNYDLFSRDEAESLRDTDTQAIDRRGPLRFERWVTFASDGHRELVETIKTPLYDDSGTLTGVLGIGRDITARRSLEGQLRRAQKLESIGTLASGVAHEINNPINGIINYAQLIVDTLDGREPDVLQYSAEINQEAERVATIVRNLLSFARMDQHPELSPASLRSLVEGTLMLVQTVCRHDQIAVHVDVPETLPEVVCHGQQIRQVLMNLVTNARDALNAKYPGHDEKKQIRITGREIDGRSLRPSHDAVSTGLPLADADARETLDPRYLSKRYVRITVEDYGCGIEPEVRDRVFDPFFSTKSRDKGTGLGLAISHGIVRDHDGVLTIESEVGQWTRVHVDLPVMESPSSSGA